MDTPPYEPTDAEPKARPAARELRARADATTASGGDRTKKAVAVAAVASFVTAMGAMAVARSGSGSAAATTPTTPTTTAVSPVSPSAGFDDGRGAAPTFGQDGATVQPGGAQPAAPVFGRGDDDFGRDDTSSHGS